MNAFQKAVIRTAADWLEANPDRHIARGLATTRKGFPRSPLAKDAHCFCAMGRIAAEVSSAINGPLDRINPYDTIGEAVGLDKDQVSDIVARNDNGSKATLAESGRQAGDARVIAMLRSFTT